MQKRVVPFQITREGQPIHLRSLGNTVNTAIRYSASYETWEALINAGATVTELLRFEEGDFPDWFIAKVIAWHRGHTMIENNIQDAIVKKQKADSKKK